MYIKMPRSGLVPRNDTAKGLPQPAGTNATKVYAGKAADDEEAKPSVTASSTKVRVEPLTIQKEAPKTTTTPAPPKSPTTTAPVFVLPPVTPVFVPPVVTPSPSPKSSSVTSSSPSSTVATSSTASYPAPIFGSPISQSPVPNTGTGTTANKNNGALTTTKPALPVGATAAISVVSVLAVLALGLLLYRKWSIRKRRKRLDDWWVPQPFLVPPPSTKPMAERAGDQPVVRIIPRVRPPSMPLPPVPVHSVGGKPGLESGAGDQMATVSPTDSAYGGYVSTGHEELDSPGAAIYKSGPSALPIPLFSPPRGARVANIGVVQCVFEPRMGDELKIGVGEALRVLAEYDDGWAFCENVQGVRGMIPLECLDRGDASVTGPGEVGLLPSLARRSMRKSSLLPRV